MGAWFSPQWFSFRCDTLIDHIQLKQYTKSAYILYKIVTQNQKYVQNGYKISIQNKYTFFLHTTLHHVVPILDFEIRKYVQNEYKMGIQNEYKFCTYRIASFSTHF